MPIVEIEPRESKQVVQDDRGSEWYIEPRNGDILAHALNSRVKQNGRLFEKGSKGHVDLKNDENLFLFNPSETDTVRVQIDKQNFEINLFPRREIERPSDAAIRQGNWDTHWWDVFAAANDVYVDDLNGIITDVAYLEQATFAYDDGAYPSDSRDVVFEIQVRDADLNVIHQSYQNPDGTTPINFDPPIRVPDGGEVKITVENNTASQVDFVASLTWRTDN